MGLITLNEITKGIVFILSLNIIFTVFLYTWVTNDDLDNIPTNPLDRIISLFYFSITTFTTTGYGDIYAKSNRMKLIISFYMIFIFAITASFLFTF